MNLLSVLAPSTKPLDPFDIGTSLADQVAMQAAVKALQVQRSMGQQVVQLLDPNAGLRLNRSA
ncbi:MAG: hypothetical protein ABI305_01650 [Tepidiformaceae bacterium]